MRRLERAGWLAVAIVLCGLAIPWFLWGSAAVVAGLPLWLWWHVGWMGLASVVFWIFTKRAWGIGVETDTTASSRGHGADHTTHSARGGERP
ncbi:DUF3311 domain-containing protein [Natronorubrum aibiense]|uniref:DUF3311 domain-containing protein n=1 Tax=Natronorubrum aibiense TaxID=348826 RepID=A0A5P9P3E6_9EURY|nr:DUF3311 domain-containing protein [Natronorubrum aibiense]QFU82658.1 DUF3311 domain-containing protein [Natronorubrum aibiense]